MGGSEVPQLVVAGPFLGISLRRICMYRTYTFVYIHIYVCKLHKPGSRVCGSGVHIQKPMSRMESLLGVNLQSSFSPRFTLIAFLHIPA